MIDAKHQAGPLANATAPMLAPQDGVEGVACVWLRTIFCLQGSFRIRASPKSPASHLGSSDVSRSTDALPGPSHPARDPRQQLEEADRLRQQGKLDRAETICHALTRRHPGYVAALHTLGLVQLDKGNYDRALDCLVRASMLDPASWMTLTALSLAYLRLGAGEIAAQTLERALAMRPRDASIFASLGEIHRQEREYDVAQQAYWQALALDPNLESAAIGLALCLAALGRSADAASVVSDAYGRGHRSLHLLHVMTMLPPGTVAIDVQP